MAKNKKPTIMEMKKVITNALIEISRLNNYTENIDRALAAYMEYKGDTSGFQVWFKNEMEKINAPRPTESGDSAGKTGAIKTGEQASSEQDKKIKA